MVKVSVSPSPDTPNLKDPKSATWKSQQKEKLLNMKTGDLTTLDSNPKN